ncbi:MAG TPA: sigma-70 family RNA polymerase sigma factor [Actinomycetota bacterium]|nr:sigma-70 family RNA polymerase sigma factor [Actinomycetota bacterium]
MELLERWVDEYQPRVYLAACLILRDPAAAEDVAQETLVRAAAASRKIAPGADASRWLSRVAVNLSLNILRSRRREERALARHGPSDDVGPGGHEEVEARLTAATVAEALGKLPDRLRVPLVLRYYLDLTEREMAALLGIRPGTVKSRLHEARGLLAMDASIEAAHSAAQEG